MVNSIHSEANSIVPLTFLYDSEEYYKHLEVLLKAKKKKKDDKIM